MQLNDVRSVRRYVCGFRREPEVVEEGTGGDHSLGNPEGLRFLDQASPGWDACKHGLVTPIFAALERARQDASQQPIGSRMAFISDQIGCSEGETGSPGADHRDRTDANQARVSEHVQVSAHGVEVQPYPGDELLRVQRAVRADRLEEANPAPTAQSAVCPAAERGSARRHRLGRGVHGLKFYTKSYNKNEVSRFKWRLG